VGRDATGAYEGLVDCPLRGPVDAERCLTCLWLTSAYTSGDSLTIRCRPLSATDLFSSTVALRAG
jgi:hypothetical protein